VSAPEPNYWPDRYARARDFLVPWVERTVPLAGRTVLEYGCGHGPVSCAFAERAGRVIGVDIDAALVEEGRRRVADHGVGDRVELERHP
jgi:ubiquinone/menaquinone biosynthesis C-methylase UbiE